MTTIIRTIGCLLAVLASLAATIDSSAQSVTVTYPNGGEYFVRNSTETITWNATEPLGLHYGGGAPLDFEEAAVSTSNPHVAIVIRKGSSAKIVTASTPNDGAFDWTISSGVGTGSNYTIVVTSTTNPLVTDTSNANFTITGTPVPAVLTLTRPNGGEMFGKGASEAITWTTSGPVGANIAITLRLGIDTWVIANPAPNTGTFNWTVPLDPPNASDFYIDIASVSNPLITDASNASFIITDQAPPNTPFVIDPINGATNVPLSPFMLSSEFSDPNEADILAAEQWQISEDVTFESAIYDVLDTDGSPDHQVAEGVLVEAAVYFVRIRYQDDTGLWSDWSDPIAFITSGDGGIGREIFLLPGNVPLEMITVPAGTFMMGSPIGLSAERPVHQVTITNEFQLGRFEITRAQWIAVMGTQPWIGKSGGVNDPESPANHVSWNLVQTFVTTLNSLTGQAFRLPSEAEWEYACRAGSTTEYCFGDDVQLLPDYGWCNDIGPAIPSIVGQLLPNAFGLFDMHGNVREWCNDWFAATYYRTSPSVDPPGPASGNGRIARGGSWDDPSFYCRSASRGQALPHISGVHVGFRIARTLPAP